MACPYRCCTFFDDLNHVSPQLASQFKISEFRSWKLSEPSSCCQFLAFKTPFLPSGPCSSENMAGMAARACAESVCALQKDAGPLIVHWLPCAIDHSGEAPVNDYFMPRTCESGRTKWAPGVFHDHRSGIKHAIMQALELGLKCGRFVHSPQLGFRTQATLLAA